MSSALRSTTSQWSLVFPSPTVRWLARHRSVCLPSLRGLLNFMMVAAGLVHVGCPWAASLSQALAAGGQSALLQLEPINERYQLWLHRAPTELIRFLRWLAVGTVYLVFMKIAGVAAGLRFPGLGRAGFDLLGTVALSAVQYPWVTGIARVRARSNGASICQQRRAFFAADAHTLVVSVMCVGASALSSVGAGVGRWALVLIGIGGAYYRWKRVPLRGEGLQESPAHLRSWQGATRANTGAYLNNEPRCPG